MYRGGLGLPLLGGRLAVGPIASGALLAAGPLLTRLGVFEAGIASSKDPKYLKSRSATECGRERAHLIERRGRPTPPLSAQAVPPECFD